MITTVTYLLIHWLVQQTAYVQTVLQKQPKPATNGTGKLFRKRLLRQ